MSRKNHFRNSLLKHICSCIFYFQHLNSPDPLNHQPKYSGLRNQPDRLVEDPSAEAGTEKPVAMRQRFVSQPKHVWKFLLRF